MTALVQAAFWSMVVPTASGLFPASRQGRAIATVFAGSSLAAIIPTRSHECSSGAK